MNIPPNFYKLVAFGMLFYTIGSVVTSIGQPRTNCTPVTWWGALLYLVWTILLAWTSFQAGKNEPAK